MTDNIYRDMFLNAAKDWICNSYSIDIRYFAGKNDNQLHLWEALIFVNPLPLSQDMNFHVEMDQFYAGQCQLSNQPKKKLLEILELVTQGKVNVYDRSFCLNCERTYNFHSEMVQHDRWFSDLHLQVSGSQSPAPTAIDVASIDNSLRSNTLPFDGLTDIASVLGLKDPRYTYNPPSINVRVGPPVDLITLECSLEDDQLTLILHAHPRFDVSRVGLALRVVPEKVLVSRKQVSANIKWNKVHNGRRVGVALINLAEADSVLAMLMIGNTTVRRHWFLDPAKARNSRLIAIQHFDKELRMIRRVILEQPDPDRFEKGVAVLLFLLGFTPVLPVETDSPDIVVTTPGGKLAIIECTTRIADFSAKLGKLVDRKGSLSKALQASSHHSRVDAILVCALPRAQIAALTDELKTHQIILISKDELATVFDQLRFPSDPDEMLDKAIAQLARANSIFDGFQIK